MTDQYPGNTDCPQIMVIDVGAAHGIQSHWKRIGSCVSITGFEPEPAAFAKLQNLSFPAVRSVNFLPYAIGSKAGQSDFYLAKARTCSSLREPDPSVFGQYDFPGSLRNTRGHIDEKITVETRTLDDIAAEHNLMPDVVKLDTQGTEYELIDDGARHTFSQISFAEIEVEFIPLYKGQKLFADIDLLMRDLGFQLIGLKRHHWKHHDGVSVAEENGGRITFGDALYASNKVLAPQIQDPGFARKASAISYAYGLGDLSAKMWTAAGLDRTLRPSFLAALSKLDPSSSPETPTIHPDKGILVDFDTYYGMEQ